MRRLLLVVACLAVVPLEVVTAQVTASVDRTPRPLWVSEIVAIAERNGSAWESAVAEAEHRCLARRPLASELPRRMPLTLRTRLVRTCVRDAWIELSADVVGLEVRYDGVWYSTPSRLHVTSSNEPLELGLRAPTALRTRSVRVSLHPGDSMEVHLNVAGLPGPVGPIRLADAVPELRSLMSEPTRLASPSPPPDRSYGTHLFWAGALAMALHEPLRRELCPKLVATEYGYVGTRAVWPGDEIHDRPCHQALVRDLAIGATVTSVLSFGLAKLIDGAQFNARRRRAEAANGRPSPTADPSRWCRENCTPAQLARWRLATANHDSLVRRHSEQYRTRASLPVVVAQPRHQLAQGVVVRTVSNDVGVEDGVLRCSTGRGGGLGVILAPESRALGRLASAVADHQLLQATLCATGQYDRILTQAFLTEASLRRTLATDGDIAAHLGQLPPSAPLAVFVLGHGVVADTVPRLALFDYNPAYPSTGTAALPDVVAQVALLGGSGRAAVFLGWLSCFSPDRSMPYTIAGDPGTRIYARDPTLGRPLVLLTATSGLAQLSYISPLTGRQLAVEALVETIRLGDTDGDGVLSAAELSAGMAAQVTERARRELNAYQVPRVFPEGERIRRPGLVVGSSPSTNREE